MAGAAQASTARAALRGRVEHVGSLVRPEPLALAWRQHDLGEIDADGLQRAQDDAVRTAVAEQERHGMPVLTDGEFRRRSIHDSLDNSIAGATTEALHLVRNAPLEEYQFSSALTDRPVKVTIVGPDTVAQNVAANGARAAYANFDSFFADVVAAERTLIVDLVAGGCEYVQVDAPGYMAYNDPSVIARMRGRGEDPIARMQQSITADNALISGIDGAIFGIHLCRGTRSREVMPPGREAAFAETLFGGLAHERLLVECDLSAAAPFDALRFVPKDKTVVLGIVSIEAGRLQTVDELCRLVDEAGRFVSPDQVALSPQCGFASAIADRRLNDAEQWQKLDVLLEAAAKLSA